MNARGRQTLFEASVQDGAIRHPGQYREGVMNCECEAEILCLACLLDILRPRHAQLVSAESS